MIKKQISSYDLFFKKDRRETMKKAVILLAMSIVITVGTVAFADYTAAVGNDKNVTVEWDNGATYSTVLITKNDESKSVAYLNQFTDAFSSSIDFMLKDDATDGEYTIKMGNASGAVKLIAFTLTSTIDNPTEGVEMTKLGSEVSSAGYQNYAFAVPAVKLGQYNAIKIVISEGDKTKTGGFKLSDVLETQINDEAEVNFGLQINNVPDSVTIEEVSLAVVVH